MAVGWWEKIWGRDKDEPLFAREENLPGLGRVRVAYVVDCIGSMCPRPQLLTMKILDQVAEGDVIEVVSDNAAAVESFPSLAQAMFSTHLLTLRDERCWRLYMRKGLGGASRAGLGAT